MTEGRALALVFTGLVVAILIGCTALKSIHAEGGAIALTGVVVGGIAVQFSSAIVLHYSGERRKR
jgi:CBS-domain-containing membrane protein